MTHSDTEILNLIRSNFNEGFALLVKTYTDRIYWHVRRIVVSFQDAEDVVQETFIRVFNSIKNFRGDCALSSWIYRIATNEALRCVERNQRHAQILEYGDGNHEIPAEEHIDLSDKAAVNLHKAIQSLPPKQRVSFTLRYYDELAYEEIGEIINSSPSAARANYHEAKNKIQKYLIDHAI